MGLLDGAVAVFIGMVGFALLLLMRGQAKHSLNQAALTRLNYCREVAAVAVRAVEELAYVRIKTDEAPLTSRGKLDTAVTIFYQLYELAKEPPSDQVRRFIQEVLGGGRDTEWERTYKQAQALPPEGDVPVQGDAGDPVVDSRPPYRDEHFEG